MIQKKVLLYTRPIVPPWDEASKNLAYDIAINMPPKSIKIALLTPRKKAFNQELVEKYSHIYPEEIYYSANLNLINKIKLLFRILRFKLKTDLVHFLFTPRSLTSFFLRWRLKFSKVKTIQTIATLSKESLSNPKKLKKILFADVIVVQSKNTLKKLMDRGIKKAQLIYPGINLNKYQPSKKNPAVLKELKLKTDDFVVLYTGEYTRLKASDDILEALKLLFKNYKDIANLKFIFACRIKSKKDQAKKNELVKIIEQEKLTNQIVFLDTFTNMEQLYNISDINIFPAREMAGKFDIPLTLVESMACGKPIIVSKLKNLKELVAKNAYGLICETKNPHDLANKIYLLKTDKKLYNKISKDALKFVRENFDIKKIVKEYNKLYKNLLNV